MTGVPRGTGADAGVDLSVACQIEFTFVLLTQDPLFDQVFDVNQIVVVGMYLVLSEVSLSWDVCAHTSDFPSDLRLLSVLTCGSIFHYVSNSLGAAPFFVTFRYAEYENFPCTLGQNSLLPQWYRSLLWRRGWRMVESRRKSRYLRRRRWWA